MLRAVRLLVLVLWPTVWVWTLPGQHRPGSGAVTAWVLVVLYSAAAVLLLVAAPLGLGLAREPATGQSATGQSPPSTQPSGSASA